MIGKFSKRRLTLILIGVSVLIAASLSPFINASCLTRQQTPAEIKSLETRRAMTRGGVLPSEDVIARIESDFPRTKAAGLARLVRARIKIRANDYAGAAGLLDTSIVNDYTALGDYSLFMRGNALEQAGRLSEARIVFEQLIRDHPSSMRAREATLRVADLLVRSGNSAAIPLLLKELTSKDDAAALLLAAKAYEQTSYPNRARAAYRRIYFYAPSALGVAQAAQAITRLGSTSSPATAEEAITRADKLNVAKSYAEALKAYNDRFGKLPGLAKTEMHVKGGISAPSARMTSEPVAACGSR